MNARDIIGSIISGKLLPADRVSEPPFEFVSDPQQPLPAAFVDQYAPAGVDFSVLRKPVARMSRREMFAVMGWMRHVIDAEAFEKYYAAAGNGGEAAGRKP